MRSPIAPQRTITMEVFDGPGTPEVIGDEARLRQVLGNLVANALQHTPDTARIIVRVGTTRNDAVLEVVDEGPGMRQRMRSGFSSGSTALTRRAPAPAAAPVWGCRSLIRSCYAHGGTVSVTTAPGQGCRFRVSLPRIADGPDRSEEFDDAAAGQSAERSSRLVNPVRPAPP